VMVNISTNINKATNYLSP